MTSRTSNRFTSEQMATALKTAPSGGQKLRSPKHRPQFRWHDFHDVRPCGLVITKFSASPPPLQRRLAVYRNLPLRHNHAMSHAILDPRGSEFSTDEEAASNDRWFRAKVQQALDDPRPGIPHDEVVRRMTERLAALKQKNAA